MTGGPVVPPAAIGVLGGGQLGRYAVLEATVLGFRTLVLDPDPGAPAGAVASEHLVAPYDDDEALARLGEVCSVVTTEFENPPSAALDRLATVTQVAPAASAVAVAQDRIAEKTFLVEHGFPVGPHVALRAEGDIDEVVGSVSGRAVVKTARLGYDGKGQVRLDDVAEVAAAWDELGRVDCVVESLLDLRTELSVIVARTAGGRTASWPVVENAHVDGILDLSVVPAAVEPGLAAEAMDLAGEIAEALGYVGVLAVELFVVGERLLVNELAPRPHNSGHWTLDASATSQFEQQVRAVCGLGLGDTRMTAPAAAMVNLLGELWFGDDGRRRDPGWADALDEPAAKLHLYGKAEPRPGRKMGHLTVLGEGADEVARRALALRAAL